MLCRVYFKSLPNPWNEKAIYAVCVSFLLLSWCTFPHFLQRVCPGHCDIIVLMVVMRRSTCEGRQTWYWRRLCVIVLPGEPAVTRGHLSAASWAAIYLNLATYRAAEPTDFFQRQKKATCFMCTDKVRGCCGCSVFLWGVGQRCVSVQSRLPRVAAVRQEARPQEAKHSVYRVSAAVVSEKAAALPLLRRHFLILVTRIHETWLQS